MKEMKETSFESLNLDLLIQVTQEDHPSCMIYDLIQVNPRLQVNQNNY